MNARILSNMWETQLAPGHDAILGHVKQINLSASPHHKSIYGLANKAQGFLMLKISCKLIMTFKDSDLRSLDKSPSLLFCGWWYQALTSGLLWSKCLCPANSHVAILTPNVMVLGAGAFGRRSGQKGGNFMNSTLMEDTPRSPLPFLLFISHSACGISWWWPKLKHGPDEVSMEAGWGSTNGQDRRWGREKRSRRNIGLWCVPHSVPPHPSDFSSLLSTWRSLLMLEKALCSSLCLMWKPSPTASPFFPSPFSPEDEERQSSPMSQETGWDHRMCPLSGHPSMPMNFRKRFSRILQWLTFYKQMTISTQVEAIRKKKKSHSIRGKDIFWKSMADGSVV